MGSELGVEAMSLYKHVADKTGLLDGVVSRVFEGITVPDAGLFWPERIRALGRGRSPRHRLLAMNGTSMSDN